MAERGERSVTVVVTSCNDGPFVAAAVESALAQSAPVAEVLVLDDGSVDDGPAALAHVSDPRVRIVCQPRRGLARLLGLGLALARTPWVVLLRGRDTLHAGCVAAALAALEDGGETPVAVLVTPRERDPSGATIAAEGRAGAAGGRPAAAAPASALTLPAVLAGELPSWSGVLLDRGRVLQAGGFDPSLRHAFVQDLWLRLLLRGRAVLVLEPLVDVTVRGAASNLRDDARAADAERARVLRRALTGTRLEDLLSRLRAGAATDPAAEASACLELARLVVRSGPRATLGLAAELAARARDLGAALPEDGALAPLHRLHPGLAVAPPQASAATVRRQAAPAPGGGLRVALEVATLDRGGLETVVYQLALGLRDAGHEPLVVCTEAGGARALGLREHGIEVAVLRGPDRAVDLARLLAARQVDLVNAHFSTFGSRVAASLGIPVVSTLHNAYAWLGSGVLEDVRRADEVVDGYVAVSQSVADYCARRFAIAPERIVVIRNSVEPAAAAEDRSSARRALGIDEDALLLVQIGRLDPIKCQLATVEAVRMLARERPSLRAWLVGGVGNPAYAHRIEARIAAAGLERHVTLAGERADVPRILAAADVFVLPSVLEGLSLAAIEAMAAGVPAVLTRTGDAEFLLGETEPGARDVLPGAIVPGPAFGAHVDSAELNALAASEEPPHAGALAAAIAEVLDDLPHRRERARARAAELEGPLSRERWLAAHVELFTAVAAAGATRRQRALAAATESRLAAARAEERSAAALDATADALSRVLLGNIASQRTAALLQRTRWDLEGSRLALVETSSVLGRALDKLRLGHRIRTALAGWGVRLPGGPAA
jgi:glycosyltransferase involved in cell wall biosynthesis